MRRPATYATPCEPMFGVHLTGRGRRVVAPVDDRLGYPLAGFVRGARRCPYLIKRQPESVPQRAGRDQHVMAAGDVLDPHEVTWAKVLDASQIEPPW